MTFKRLLKRQVLLGITIATMITALPTEASAKQVSSKVTEIQNTEKPNLNNNAKVSNVKLMVDGEYKSLSDPIVIDEGRVFLPVRTLGEVLGIDVDYLSDYKTAKATNPTASLELPLGYNKAVKDGTLVIPVDKGNPRTRIILYNSRTYLPVRFVSENLGYNIQYGNQTVSITTDGTEPTVPNPDKIEPGYESKMNPADPNNPYNLMALKEGRSISQLPTAKMKDIPEDPRIHPRLRESMIKLDTNIVLASGPMSALPKHINEVNKKTGEEFTSQGFTNVSRITITPTGEIKATRSAVVVDINFKDGSKSKVSEGQNPSVGLSENGGKRHPGKKYEDIANIYIVDSSSGGVYIFFPTSAN